MNEYLSSFRALKKKNFCAHCILSIVALVTEIVSSGMKGEAEVQTLAPFSHLHKWPITVWNRCECWLVQQGIQLSDKCVWRITASQLFMDLMLTAYWIVFYVSHVPLTHVPTKTLFYTHRWTTFPIGGHHITLMEITKCPPFFRKLWAFKATILVWSGWATSAKITSTMPRKEQDFTHLTLSIWLDHQLFQWIRLDFTLVHFDLRQHFVFFPIGHHMFRENRQFIKLHDNVVHYKVLCELCR